MVSITRELLKIQIYYNLCQANKPEQVSSQSVAEEDPSKSSSSKTNNTPETSLTSTSSRLTLVDTSEG